MKLKSIAILSSMLSVFLITSCNNTNNDPYKDKIVKESSVLDIQGSIVTEYDVSSGGKSIELGTLKVYYPKGTEIEYFNSDDEKIESGKFFITLSDATPTLSRIKKSDKMSTNKKTYSLNVYVGVIDKKEDKVHLSKAIPITLKNSKALNPVLYYVGTAVIFVAIGVLIYFTKKYKETH